MKKFVYGFVSAILLAVPCISVMAQQADLGTWFANPLQYRQQIIDAVSDAEKVYKKRVVIEPRLFGVLESSSSGAEAKEFAATQLYRIIDEDSIRSLEKLLLRKSTSAHARRGLEQINHRKAQEALLGAVDQATGSVLAGLVESLGVRGEKNAVTAIRKLVRSGNTELVEAGLIALGNIPGEESALILGWARTGVKRSQRALATRSYIQNGWKSLETGDTASALDVFDMLMVEVEPVDVRAEALRGVIRAEGINSVPTIVDMLNGSEPRLQAVAAEEAGKVPGREVTEALVAVYPDLTYANQAIVLRILGERGDKVGLPLLTRSVNHRDPDVRYIALEAVTKFNDAETVQVLLKVAATGTPDERTLAKSALARLDGPTIDDELNKGAMSADNTLRSQAVLIMVDRKSVGSISTLLRMAERDIPPLRLVALNALGVLATSAELTAMVELLIQAWDEESTRSIAQSIESVAVRSPAGAARTEPLAKAALASSNPVPIRLELLRILGMLQDDSGLAALRSAAKSRNGEEQLMAVGALADWPNAAPVSDLEKVARATKNPQVRARAFDGFLRLLTLPSDRSDSETVKLYGRGVKLVSGTEEKAAMKTALQAWSHGESADLVARLEKSK